MNIAKTLTGILLLGAILGIVASVILPKDQSTSSGTIPGSYRDTVIITEGFRKYARVDTLTGPDGCTYAVLVHESLGESVLPALTHSPKCNNH